MVKLVTTNLTSKVSNGRINFKTKEEQIMKSIKNWMAEGFTGKRQIMGRYRKVSSIKPMRIAVVYIGVMAIVTGLGALITMVI